MACCLHRAQPLHAPGDHVYGEGPDGDKLRHRVTVRRVFRESAEAALQSELVELLPLVTVMEPSDGDHAALLTRVVNRILDRRPDGESRTMLLEQAQNFATLHLSRKTIDGVVNDALRRHRIMLDPLRDFPYVRDGYRRGKTEGKAEGKAESVIAILEARGVRVSKAVRATILSCTDAARLDLWVRTAVSADSVADVLRTS